MDITRNKWNLIMQTRSITAGLLLLFCSANALAGATTFSWEFGYSEAAVYNNKINAEKYGIQLEVSAWSSSWHGNNSECQMGWNNGGEIIDKCIQRTNLKKFHSGLGNVNGDENGSAPEHALDNTDYDYDMVMLEFSEEVNISTIYTGYNEVYSTKYNRHGQKKMKRKNRTGQAGVSVMGYADNDRPAPFSDRETWDDILNQGWSLLDNNAIASRMATLSSGSTYAADVNVSNLYSKYWLVGAAYHGYEYNSSLSDHIKLAGIQIEQNKGDDTTVSVNNPATLSLFAIGGLFVLTRRKMAIV